MVCYLPKAKGGHARHVETGQVTPPRTPSEEATDPQNQSLSMGEHRVTIKLSKISAVASSRSMRMRPYFFLILLDFFFDCGWAASYEKPMGVGTQKPLGAL